MRIETLNEFLVLAHYLNYTAAARNLHLSQPNLSRHILELEHEIGVTLLTRGKDVQLTPAGSAFLEDVIQIHHAYKASLERCRAIHHNSAEEVVIQEPYFVDSLGEILYKTVRAFRGEHPLEPIRLYSERGKKSVESLESQHVDIATTLDYGEVGHLFRHGERKGLIYIPVVREPLCVWLHESNRLTRVESLKLEDLDNVPINMTAVRHFDPMRYGIIDLFARYGMRVDLRTAADATLEEFYLNTRNKDSVFLVTAKMARHPVLQMQEQMKVAPLDDLRARQTSYLVLRSDYSKRGIDLFLRVLETVIAEEIVREDGCQYLAEIVD